MENQKIITSLLSIEEIVRNNFFSIPDYQRGYSWENGQLVDLIKDIEYISTKDHRHYTGTMVITSENGKYAVVDGQQRLTTLIILLKVVYDTDSVKYASIKESFLVRKEGGYVLETNAETNRYFKEAILGNKQGIPCNIKSLSNLRNAKKFFESWIEQNSTDVDKIYSTVINKLGFICFSPENTNEIGIMFEVINNRGKALSELEKIKNYFIYYATINSQQSLRDKINDNWGEILRYLSEAGVTSNDEENSFLRNCYIVFFSTNKQKSWYVYDELKELYKPEDILNLNDKVEDIESFIDFINEAARHYAFFYNGSIFQRDYQGELKDDFTIVLKRLRCHPVNASIFPLYLSAMSYLYQRTTEVLQLLQFIEITNFRVYVLPNTKIARADTHQGSLFSWAYELFNDREWNSNIDPDEYYTWRNRKIEGDIFSFVVMNLEDFIIDLCPEEVFIQSLTIDRDEAINYYNWNGLRFFLASYEEILNSNRKESWDIERILNTIEDTKQMGNDYLSKEHIWASKNRVEDFPEKIQEKRRLGNFVLLGLSSNIQLQHEDIDQKVDILVKNSSISMLQINKLHAYLENAITIAQSRRERKTKYYYQDIAISLIDQRETELIKFALKRWRLPSENFNKFEKINTFEANELNKNENYFLKVKQ